MPCKDALPQGPPFPNPHASQYTDEHDLPTVMSLIDNDLSEPYSIFTYRYFLSQWPHLCFLAYDGGKPCGVVVCKMDVHREKMMRGYIAMLVVNKHYRGHGIGEPAG
jgi:peptide alpha-N-acetyltransferase